MSSPLIPRDALFGNPDHADPQVSPDGRWLSWLAPHQGVLNVWVAPVDDPSSARTVTRDTERGVRSYAWAYDGTHLLYEQDVGGDEDWHLRAASITGDSDRDLTPLKGIQARLTRRSPRHPERVVVGINDREPSLHDLYSLNLATGERELLLQNPGFIGFVLNDDLEPVIGVAPTADGGMTWMRATAEGWQPLAQVDAVDALTTAPIALDPAGTTLYLLDSRDRDTAAAVRWDLDSGEPEPIGHDPRADVSDLLMHPTTHAPQAVAVNYERTTWTVLDDDIGPDLGALAALAPPSEVRVLSRDLQDTRWTVALVRSDAPVEYYLWDRASQRASLLFTSRSRLADAPLRPMQSTVIPARDGLQLVSYLTRPEPGDAPAPLVLLVHGGPWARDAFGYNAFHQWLANRGYAALSVNFRGSTGFGKRFLNAGDLEWGAAMHTDLLDAVAWAVDQGITTEDQVAIMGGSYGGYAVLAGLAFTPTVFACGVDIVGPSNLETLIGSIPAYWKPMIAQFHNRVGNPETDEGKALLHERSPVHAASRIERPLLIAQGANDPRVKQAESDQIVTALTQGDIPVTYVLFPDEGHGFARPVNNLAFMAIAERFLAGVLGGRVEPIGGVLEASSAQILAGETPS